VDSFIGRQRELERLGRMLARVERGGRAGRPGRAVLMRGRRRVGKSRLAEEFIHRADVPSLFFTASTRRTLDEDLRLFVEAGAKSSLLRAALFQGQAPQDWDAALSLLATALPEDRPSVVVIDEMPYLLKNDPGFEGTLQKIFDRELSHRPVLLLCIGSDLAMMEALNDYGRPFHQRATEMVIPPLSPADVAQMLSLPAADAFDAYLVSGGLPLILDEWTPGFNAAEYLEETLFDPTSALMVSAERALNAEFPPEAQARTVLGALGAGERTHTSIGRAAGGLPQGSLTRSLKLLVDKRMVEVATPLSTKSSRETRYWVADPYLRFWLAFLEPHMDEVERGRGDLVMQAVRESWTAWRGRAIEPVIRESLRRMPDGPLPEGTRKIGGYWTRTNDPEVDIIGADRAPVAKRITAVGSIKWLERRPFDGRDLARLILHRSQVPGAGDDTALLAVTRSGAVIEGITAVGPEQLLSAWQ
jgi:AAA+ ATPase superfamily predicted ATPase